MDKSQKSHIAKLSLIALLLITPLLSTSMRPPYLYFLTNLLLIAVGAEAGLLSSFSKPPNDKKAVIVAPNPALVPSLVAELCSTNTVGGSVAPECTERKAKVVEKSASEKIVAVCEVHKVKKCPSMPSLFFIEGGDAGEEETDEEQEEEAGGLNGQELYTKAETFISNFYKQLKIQREESWKRIHGALSQGHLSRA